jgi:hypothetical protein
MRRRTTEKLDQFGDKAGALSLVTRSEGCAERPVRTSQSGCWHYWVTYWVTFCWRWRYASFFALTFRWQRLRKKLSSAPGNAYHASAWGREDELAKIPVGSEKSVSRTWQ